MTLPSLVFPSAHPQLDANPNKKQNPSDYVKVKPTRLPPDTVAKSGVESVEARKSQHNGTYDV